MAIILDAEHPPTEQNAIIEEVLAPRRVIDATKTDRVFSNPHYNWNFDPKSGMEQAMELTILTNFHQYWLECEWFG